MTAPERNPGRMIEQGLGLVDSMRIAREEIHGMFVHDSILLDKLRLAQKIAHCEAVLEEVIYDIQYEYARMKRIEQNRVPIYDEES